MRLIGIGTVIIVQGEQVGGVDLNSVNTGPIILGGEQTLGLGFLDKTLNYFIGSFAL